MLKYCVAAVKIYESGPSVTFYAYQNNAYGLHRVSNINDENIIWYDTESEAMKNRWNSNDCVLGRWFD